jgi:hypothetical protein
MRNIKKTKKHFKKSIKKRGKHKKFKQTSQKAVSRKYKKGGERPNYEINLYDSLYRSSYIAEPILSYLNDVIFNIEDNDALKELILRKSFYPDDKYSFENLEKKLLEIIPNNTNKEKKWSDCKDECYNYCSKIVSIEINSTAYILRLLTNSVIGDTKNNKITFDVLNYDIDDFTNKLTGKWIDDYKFFNIKINNTNNKENIKNGRLIMGFGPSASGKTHCADIMIELMNTVETNFPTFFISIDGGIYREQSMTYQSILKTCITNNIFGITNLVSASVFTSLKGIFDSNIIKKLIKDYLIFQKNNNELNISLYVPETISDCVNCYSKYKSYIDITGDNNWIGIMIYQHKTYENCIYKDEYKCKGTTESGTTREIKEGKKYSSSAWEVSYKNGNREILNAPNYRFRIHNSGRLGYKSILEDLSETKIINNNNMNKEIINKNNTILNFLNNGIVNNVVVNWEYINGKIKNNAECLKYINEKNQSYCNK